MSVNLRAVVIEPGEDDYLEEAWELKERIRRSEGILKQRKGFFADSYRRAKVHAIIIDGELGGFTAVRPDGYILFLAIDARYRGKGLGRQLIERVAKNHETVTCHARATNEQALKFYQSVGFEAERHIEGYYEDGGDAYYLRLGGEGGITDRISEILR
ncbi:GNAT family N-acetyltransferase [Salinarchaeum sp. IM2453]|uniref:GNAT family N-acetyltransferase n=1 Tax=Salinarchaeum sp. IM2453 TaxID=2862870 RepID=UPI001C830B69|nr:N-acetyltransferase [Salinarchaeum sp. IM2453]QZA87682.1 GNAT family N-acetyltransferase [Salinarchaeum sp. IM2453]